MNEKWRSDVWSDEAARVYSGALEISDYVSSIISCVQSEEQSSVPQSGYRSLLDIGAGDGRFAKALTCVGARVDAVEPSAFMREKLRERLADRIVRAWDTTWQDFPDIDTYELGFAANIGAFKAAPLELYKKMKACCERMIWVVPAQKGPSSFCLCGLVAHWLPDENQEPVFHSVLRKLGQGKQPISVVEQSWTYRQYFPSQAAATDALAGWLEGSGVTIHRDIIEEFVGEKGAFDDDKGVTLEAPKRSAILRWD